MADFLRTSITTVAQTLIGSESGLITSNGGIYSSGADAITVTAGTNQVVNDGYIYAYGGGFAAIDVDAAVFELLNGRTGLIDAENPTEGTIDLDVSTLARITNHGVIHSMNDEAIEFQDNDGSANFQLTNTGDITVNDGFAVDGDAGGGFYRISNSGLISGFTTALNLTTDLVNSNNHVIINSGTIESTSASAILVGFGDNGAFQVRNSGTISGWTTGIGSVNGTDVTIFNSGVIEGIGLQNAIKIEEGSDVVRNSGTILGDVELGSGADLFDGTGGTVNGIVYGESGQDTLLGSDQADLMQGGNDDDTLIGRDGDDVLDGGNGLDFILGGAGNDEMDGDLENDTLNANAGDDTVYGGDGNDVLIGQDGSDMLEGDAGQDILDGGNGDDILEGGADNDILRGRNGEDELAGGLGRDFLTGGQGADVFVFRSTAETVVGANRDQILDFEQGIDVITVAGLSPGVFEFRGTAAFAPSGNPELRLFETPTGSTIVQIDNNGDGVPDAEIRVANVTGLTADDFVL